jgi:hypothetical protein
MRRLLGAVVPVGIALVCTVVAAPVRADQVTMRDQRHDVSETRVGDDAGSVYQANIREGDFIATTFRHGPRAVVVTSRFRELDRVGNHHGYFLRLESGRHVYRDVTLEAGPGLWRGRHVVTNRRGDRVRCAVQHAINYRLNTVRMIVPRSCLGRPRVVRGTAAAMWTRPDLDDPSQPDFLDVDNPHNADTVVDTWTRWIRRG